MESSRLSIRLRTVPTLTKPILPNPIRPAQFRRTNTQTSKLQFRAPISLGKSLKPSILPSISLSLGEFQSELSVAEVDESELDGKNVNNGVSGITIWIRWFRSVLLGDWWKLGDSVQMEDGKVKSTSVSSALWRIWVLVATGDTSNRWVVFCAFASLSIAALSEISMPSLIATSIFAAENGESKVFLRHSRLLVILWFTSGICSGLRGGCFGIADSILICRLSV